MNYFLGIDASSGVLVADFEDDGDGPNHPSPARRRSRELWHHAAATYDGTTWRLYLDGVLDAKLARRRHAASRLDPARGARDRARLDRRAQPASSQGDLDEVRIWNVARTGAQIRAAQDAELSARRPACSAAGR